MPRRLLDSDPQRERRRQMQIIGGIMRNFNKRYRQEISRASLSMVDTWEAMGSVEADSEHEKRIEAIMKQNWRASIEKLAGRIREQAKAKGYPQVTKAEAEDAFALYEQEFMEAFGAAKIQRVTGTTKQQVAQLIDRGRANGDSVDDIAKRIRERVPVLAGVRANVIARTETHTAGNFAANKQAKDTGLPMRKEWIAADDERTRMAHDRADGQTTSMDGVFNVNGESLEYPGDASGSAANVINCRCALGHIVED